MNLVVAVVSINQQYYTLIFSFTEMLINILYKKINAGAIKPDIQAVCATLFECPIVYPRPSLTAGNRVGKQLSEELQRFEQF